MNDAIATQTKTQYRWLLSPILTNSPISSER